MYTIIQTIISTYYKEDLN